MSRKTIRLLAAWGGALFPMTASAQPGPGVIPPPGVVPGLNCNFLNGHFAAACIPSFVAYLIAFVFSLVGLFFLLNVMFAGYQIALKGFSSDDQAGKNRLRWSIIGLIVAICSFVILDFLLSVFTYRI